jgi:hypothetical protein
MGEKKVRRPEYPGLNLNEGQLKGWEEGKGRTGFCSMCNVEVSKL